MSSAVLVAIFLVSAGAIWVSGMVLAGTVDTLDGRFGWGDDVGGAVILGIVTSLPELAIVVSAAAGGELELATGNILGGIAIQTVVLVLLDARSPSNQPLSSAAGSLVLSLEALTVIGVVTFAVMGSQLNPDSPARPPSLACSPITQCGLFAATSCNAATSLRPIAAPITITEVALRRPREIRSRMARLTPSASP